MESRYTPEMLKEKFKIIDLLITPTFKMIKKVISSQQEQGIVSLAEEVEICHELDRTKKQISKTLVEKNENNILY